jgi:hypothetical protein
MIAQHPPQIIIIVLRYTIKLAALGEFNITIFPVRPTLDTGISGKLDTLKITNGNQQTCIFSVFVCMFKCDCVYIIY